MKCNLSCENLFYFLTIYFRRLLVKECGFEDGQMLCKDIQLDKGEKDIALESPLELKSRHIFEKEI